MFHVVSLIKKVRVRVRVIMLINWTRAYCLRMYQDAQFEYYIYIYIYIYIRLSIIKYQLFIHIYNISYIIINQRIF